MLTLGDKKWVKAYFGEAFKDAFEEVHILLRNDIAQFKDEILTELHPLREDHDVLSYHSSEHSNQLENHDRRITALERHNPHPPAIVAVAEKARAKYEV